VRLDVILGFALLVFLSACAGPADRGLYDGFEGLSGPYLGLESPGSTPQLLLPGLVSTYGNERTVC
jgi:hypothetical protein